MDVHSRLLPVSPDARHGLKIDGWIPVRIEQDQAIAADQIQTNASSLGAQQEPGASESKEEAASVVARFSIIRIALRHERASTDTKCSDA